MNEMNPSIKLMPANALGFVAQPSLLLEHDPAKENAPKSDSLLTKFSLSARPRLDAGLRRHRHIHPYRIAFHLGGKYLQG